MQKIDGRSLGVVMREDAVRQPELNNPTPGQQDKLTRFVQLFVNLHRMDYRLFQNGLTNQRFPELFPRLYAWAVAQTHV